MTYWFGTSYHMTNDKAIFFLILKNAIPNKYLLPDDRSLSVVGFGTIQLDVVISMMYYVIQVFPTTCYYYIKSLIQVNVK